MDKMVKKEIKVLFRSLNKLLSLFFSCTFAISDKR